MTISRSIRVASNGVISFSDVIQYLSFSDLFLESPLDCKEIKPVNHKEINPEYSLEGLMLKLKLHYFGHLM